MQIALTEVLLIFKSSAPENRSLWIFLTRTRNSSMKDWLKTGVLVFMTKN